MAGSMPPSRRGRTPPPYIPPTGPCDMARPSKYSPAVHDRIVLALRAGNYRKVAAASAGVSEATFHAWMKSPRKQLRGFQEAVARAEAEFEVTTVGQIARKVATSPESGFKLLERRYPGRWGRARGAGLNGAPDPDVFVDPTPQPDEKPAIRWITAPPDWGRIIMRLHAVAATGITPEEFFEGPDRLAQLREDSSPKLVWWKAAMRPDATEASEEFEDADPDGEEDEP